MCPCVCACVSVRACLLACLLACVRACVRACVLACVLACIRCARVLLAYCTRISLENNLNWRAKALGECARSLLDASAAFFGAPPRAIRTRCGGRATGSGSTWPGRRGCVTTPPMPGWARPETVRLLRDGGDSRANGYSVAVDCSGGLFLAVLCTPVPLVCLNVSTPPLA